MGRRLNHAWRVVATGLCFLVFGLAGLVLRLVLFPPMMLVLRDAERLQRASRSVTHHFFRFFVGLMRFVGVLTYELHGVERLGKAGQLVLANHPTLIDVVFLISLIPQSDCVVKAALGKNPFTRGPVRATGYITNDGGVALVEDSRRSLTSGSTLVIFPEGTRTPRDGRVTLMRGAANVAIRCRAPVTPVVIRCEPLTLGKGEKWYKVPPRRVHFTITVHDDIEVQPYLAAGAPEPVAVRRLNADLQSFFEQESRRASA